MYLIPVNCVRACIELSKTSYLRHRRDDWMQLSCIKETEARTISCDVVMVTSVFESFGSILGHFLKCATPSALYQWSCRGLPYRAVGFILYRSVTLCIISFEWFFKSFRIPSIVRKQLCVMGFEHFWLCTVKDFCVHSNYSECINWLQESHQPFFFGMILEDCLWGEEKHPGLSSYRRSNIPDIFARSSHTFVFRVVVQRAKPCRFWLLTEFPKLLIIK